MGEEDKGTITMWPMILVASLVGGGSGLGALQISDVRPDPYTGTMAQAEQQRQDAIHRNMEEEWHGDLNRVINRVDSLEQRMNRRFDELQNLILDRHR